MSRKDDDKLAADQIRVEQLLLLLEQSFPGAFISAFVGVVVVAVLWGAQDQTVLLSWLAAVFVVGLSRLYFHITSTLKV